MKKNLLYINEEDKKALEKMGYFGSIEKVSRYCDLSQKLLNVFLVAYDQGIKELDSNQVVIIWYKLYGNKLQTCEQIRARLYSLGYSPFLKSITNDKRFLYSLIEDKIDELRYELSLKSSEYKKYRVTPTPESIYARFDEEITERLNKEENKELLNKIKAMTKEQILQLTIADLPLTHRVSHYLACDNIETVEDLIKSRTRKELLRIPNFGQKCIKEVEQVLARLGLALETN